MFHRLLRFLAFTSFLTPVFLQVNAQICPDVTPVVIGPASVREGTILVPSSVEYYAPLIANHNYVWSLPLGGGSLGSTRTDALYTYRTVNWDPIVGGVQDFQVKLAESYAGCTDTKTLNVRVNPLLHAYFYYQYDPTGGCYYNVVNFTGDVSVHSSSAANITYSWDFGDLASGAQNASNQINPQHTFVGGPWPVTFTVTLTITDNSKGVSDMITDYVYVDPDQFKPTAVIDAPIFPTPNCATGAVTFNGSNSIPKPPANPSVVTMRYYNWNFSDPSGMNNLITQQTPTGTPPPAVTHTFSAPGSYWVYLTVTNIKYCENTDSILVTIDNSIPVALFQNNTPCFGLPTNFTDMSNPSIGNIASWSWNFGDPLSGQNSSNAQNPTHTFSSVQVFNTTLTIVNNRGCTNSYSAQVTVNKSPKANFQNSTACIGDLVSFTNTSTLEGGSAIATNLWDFGDGTTSPDANPNHLFPAAQTYTVTLTETNVDGCSNTFSKLVTINPKPDIDFTWVTTNTVYQATFTAIINPAQFVSNNIVWTFGDGSPSQFGTIVTHTFPGPGAFTVRATATDMVTGCSSYKEYGIDAGAPPSAFFSANPPDQCEGEVISFIAGPPGGLITTEHWDYHDGTTDDFVFNTPQCCPANPTHTYATSGPYHVTRTVNAGTASEATWDVFGTIYPKPGAEFVWFSDPNESWQGQACADQNVYFRDASFSNSIPPGNIYKWSWDFGDPGNGPLNNVSTLQNPTHIFSAAGTAYIVTLTVWDNLNNCQSLAVTHPVLVDPAIPTEFTYNDFACIDKLMNFTPDPAITPSDYTWLWDFGDGSPQLTTPGAVSHLFPATGTWTITLTLTDQFGCSKAKQHTVTVIPLPIANFIFTTPSCDGSPIQFTDQSVTPTGFPELITGWLWKFGDGTTSTLQNPVHTYLAFNPAGYDVTLIDTTSRGCSDSTTKHVTPIPGPKAIFQVQPLTPACSTQVVQFQDLSQENGGGTISTWHWDFGDLGSGSSNVSPAQNPQHTFSANGPYLITLTVMNGNGCSNTDTATIYINALPAADFTALVGCEGIITTFTDASITPNPSIITSYTWTFGDGGSSNQVNPQHMYAVYGSYIVTLTIVNSNGCINTKQQTITVNAKPIPQFTFSAAGCVGAPVNYTDQSYIPGSFSGHIDHWTWNFGDSSPLLVIPWLTSPNVTHTFLGNVTSHIVWLAVYTTNGCVDSISHTVTSIPSPVAAFAFTNTNCLGQLVHFTDLSSANGGSSIQTWHWDFDDPLSGGSNNSPVPDPDHTFAVVGQHIVSLTVTSVNGCTSIITDTVTIHPLPIADFTYVDACEGNPTQFTNASTTPNGIPIISYSWNFGDAGTSTSQSPPHSYSVAGLYTVTLTVVDSLGCTKTVSKPVIVNPKPVAEFSYSAASCVGNAVDFTDHSYVPTSPGSSSYINTWVWDFGDGSPQVTLTFPAAGSTTHTFSGTGTTFTVRLTVTTTANCTFFIDKTVTLSASPIASFTYSPTLCALQPVLFHDQTQLNGGGNLQSWLWDFGDIPSGASNISHIPNPQHSFTAAGTYKIKLTVTNTNGCVAYDTTTSIIINAKPLAKFSADSACLGSVTTFTDLSVAATPATITGWNWDFGDGLNSTTSSPTHTYATAGVYAVKLTVTSSQGCTKDTTEQVEIFGKPVASFSFNSPTCASDSVHFTSQSTSPHGYVYKYDWNFGDGTPHVTRTFPASPNVSHKYLTGGTYSVQLTITSSDSCTAQKINQVQVKFAPLADFNYDPTLCAIMLLPFHDLSQENGGGTITTWLWNFGDLPSGINNTSASPNPTHAFTSGGPKTVKLTVTNINGCTDTTSRNITINDAPIAKFAADTSCITSPTSFTDQSTTASGTNITAWSWDFGDIASGPNNFSTLPNPTHIYNTPGTYNVKLEVTNSNNCIRDTIVTITVNPKPVALFQYTASCVSDSTQFTDQSTAPNSSVVSWHWDFGDGVGTSTIQNPKYTYNTAGSYNVKLVVTNLSSCKDSVTIPVTARPKPVAAYSYLNHFCPAGQVNFQDQSTGVGAAITTRLWTFEGGNTSGITNPTHTFPVTNMNYAVSLMVTDNYGCKDTITDSVFVKPGFSFTYSNDTVCFKDPTHFHTQNLAQGDSLYTLTWSFDDPTSGPLNTSSIYDPVHTFMAPGVYFVKLKAFNSDNCVDSVLHQVTVHSLPLPSYSFVSTPCDSVIHFTDMSSAVSGDIASWEWDFGDGSTLLNIPSPGPGDTSHLYVNEGVYTVTLRVNSTYGCTDTIKKTVERFPCIKAIFTNDTMLCARYPITFSDSSLPVTRINQWHWLFGDGHDTTYQVHASSITHTFAAGGTYPVSLIITASVNGKTFVDTAQQNITIHPTPLPLFSEMNACLHQVNVFRDTSATYGEPVSAWTWVFGQPAALSNDSAFIVNPTHKYDTAGYYNVKLVVKNRFGCKDSVTKPTRVYALPQAKLDHEPACDGNPTVFHDLSIPADTILHSWFWNFGNLASTKDTSALENPIYFYKTAGSYDVKLIVKDLYGCIDTVDSTVLVHVTPVSAFTVTQGYNNMTGRLLLNNKTSGADTYVWDFGNGQTSSDANPVVTYADDGTYIIMLVSSNQYLCADTTYYKYEFLFHGLYIPNAFAPTSGILGVSSFKAVGINLQEYRMDVYDAWGHLVWTTTALDADGRPTESWDGRGQNGEVMPMANYIWKVSATFIDGTVWKGSDSGTGNTGTYGTVTLVR